MGERIVRNDEVAGSTPVSSTNVFNHLKYMVPVEKSGLCPKCALTLISFGFRHNPAETDLLGVRDKIVED